MRAKAKLMPIAERYAQAHFVGIVRVIATTPTWAVGLPEEERHKHHLQSASVRVVLTIKGADVPSSFQLEFDNGLSCRNVLYKSDRTYLAFLARQEDGTFSTVNYYYGQVEVSGTDVVDWERAYGSRTPVEQVRQELLALSGSKSDV